MEPDGPCCEQSTAGFEPRPDDDERLAALCRALAHPHRVHILRFLLAQRACFAGEIAEQLPVAPSTVSQHLTHLKDAGLVKGEVDGPRRCYCVDPDVLGTLKALVEAL
jgi:ArsR family transcriptional regulator, arsenate/arsenite/antimonite-responsive transcriptional repressor